MPNVGPAIETVARFAEAELGQAAAGGGDTNLLSLIEQCGSKLGLSFAERDLSSASMAALTDRTSVTGLLHEESRAAAVGLPQLTLENGTKELATHASPLSARTIEESSLAPWAHPLRKSYGFDPLL